METISFERRWLPGHTMLRHDHDERNEPARNQNLLLAGDIAVAHHFYEHDGTSKLSPPVFLLTREATFVKRCHVLNRRQERRRISCSEKKKYTEGSELHRNTRCNIFQPIIVTTNNLTPLNHIISFLPTRCNANNLP